MDTSAVRGSARVSRLLIVAALVAAPFGANATTACSAYINSDGTTHSWGVDYDQNLNSASCKFINSSRTGTGVYTVAIKNAHALYSVGDQILGTYCTGSIINTGTGTASITLSPNNKPGPVGPETTTWTIRTFGAPLGLLQVAVDRDFILRCSGAGTSGEE